MQHIPFDECVIDVLLPDLTHHARAPGAFLVYANKRSQFTLGGLEYVFRHDLAFDRRTDWYYCSSIQHHRLGYSATEAVAMLHGSATAPRGAS